MRRISLVSLVGLLAALGFAACGGSSDEGGGDSGNPGGTSGSSSGGSAGTSGSSSGGSGTSGASGKGGTGGTGTGGATNGGTGTGGAMTGGSAGSTPQGGDAGTAPNGGTAGGAGEGAKGGAGSGGGGGRECETADDCMLFTDCCTCAAVPTGTSVPICELVCIQNRCAADQIDADEVTCSFGRCVIDRSCDHAQATCNSDPEPCTGGQVRSVNENGCWGPCIPPTECRDVTNCDACGDAVCVIEEPQIRSFGCVVPDASCTKGNYCECLGACPTSGFVCMEESDAVHCPCPVC